MPLAPALIDLVPLLMFAVALALCLLSLYLARALFGTVGGLAAKIPVVGGWLDSKVEDVAHKITSGLGHAATVLEARVGASWHSFARLVDWMGREIGRHGALLERIATDLVTANFADLIRLEAQGARRLIHYVEKQVVGIGHDVTIRLRTIEKGIGADVLPRLRSLDRRLGHVIDHDIAGLRARAKVLERDYDALFKWIRSHPWTLVTPAFVGAVAVALARLGLDWIRCPTAKAVFRKRGCNLWNGLDDVLGLFVDVALITNMCRVIPWLEEGFSLTAAPLVAALTKAGAGLCDPSFGPPELLPAPGLYLPPVQALPPPLA